MKRYLLLLTLGSVGLLVALAAAYFLLDAPEPDQRMVRARALFDTENYLSALQMLRNVPPGARNGAETHAYLGAAYLHLHLYQAALEEFQAAGKQSPRTLDPWVGLAAVHLRLGDGQKALEGAGRAVDVAQNSVDAWLILGRAHWFQRNFGEAEKAAKKVRELDPSNLQATELLLNIYFDQKETQKFQELIDGTPAPNGQIQDLAVRFAVRRGEFRRALDLRTRFDRRNLESQILRSQLALAREPGLTDSYPLLITNLVKLRRFEEAIAAGHAYRGSVPIDLEMGKAHRLAGNRGEAIRAYERASDGKIHKLSAEVALAVITGEQSHWLEAFRAERIERDYFVLAQIEETLKSGSPLVKALAYRYVGLYDSDFFNKSAEQARAVLDREPDQFEALMTLSTAYKSLGRVDDAMRYAERGRELYPNRSEPWSRLGELSLLNDVAQAAQYMEKAAKLDPGNPNCLYNYGWILDQLDRDAEAVPYYERAIAASSLSFESMNNLALIENNAGRRDRAIALLNRAVASSPENDAAYFNRANYYASQRSWREALEDYRRVLDFNPGNVFARVESGRIYLELNDVEQAIEKLNEALEFDPNTFDAYVLMSSAYEKIGRKHEAGSALREAKRIRPDAPEIGKGAK